MTSRSRIIGLYGPANRERAIQVAEGVQRYVERHAGLSLVSFCSNDDSFEYATTPPVQEPPWKDRVDGAVVFLRRHPEMMAWTKSGGVPVVNTIGETVDTPIVTVYDCPATKARLAVDHLVELGYRTFGYVGYSTAYRTKIDRDALAAELAGRKLKLQTAIEVERAYPCEFADEFVRLAQANPPIVDLVKQTRKPLALIANGSHFAVALTRIAGWLGLRIPEDVAVLSLVDNGLARVTTPSITSIRTRGEQAGYEAARVLHRMLEGKRLSKTSFPVPDCELIVRESTSRRHSEAHDAIGRALEIVRRDGCGKLRVEDVAARACISLRSLEINFAAAIGHSVGDEIRMVRLARIKELLSETDLSLNQIAKRTGFSGGAYLNKFFRQWAKVDALDFRRRQRKKVGKIAAKLAAK